MMAPEMEKPRVTEIRVRMDCNGCVQKIKKALHGVTGIYELYIDSDHQKVTVLGCADPAKIVKAIKKTRKSAVICSHTEQSDEAAQPTGQPEPEPEPEDGTLLGGAPPPESSNPPTEQPQTDAAPPAEGQKEEVPPSGSSQPDNPPPEANPSSESAKDPASQYTQTYKPQNLEEIHVIHHHPPDYGSRYAYGPYLHQGNNGGQWNAYPNSPQIRVEPSQLPQPIHMTHSYNTYKPSPYVTKYAYPNQPPLAYSRYDMPEQYSQVYYSGNNGSAIGGQWNAYSSGPQMRGEPSQLPQPIHYYSRNTSSSNGRQWNTYSSGQQIHVEPSQLPQAIHETHSYNIYKPSPYTTDYAYPQSPQGYSHYNTPDNYSQAYSSGNNGSGNGNITSMFSEENPNACSIV